MAKIIKLAQFKNEQQSPAPGAEVILKMSEKHSKKFRKLENEFMRLADAMYHDFKSENMLLGPKSCFLRATLAGFAKEVAEMIEAEET